jgi:hypothetical protein
MQSGWAGVLMALLLSVGTAALAQQGTAPAPEPPAGAAAAPAPPAAAAGPTAASTASAAGPTT